MQVPPPCQTMMGKLFVNLLVFQQFSVIVYTAFSQFATYLFFFNFVYVDILLLRVLNFNMIKTIRVECTAKW